MPCPHKYVSLIYSKCSGEIWICIKHFRQRWFVKIRFSTPYFSAKFAYFGVFKATLFSKYGIRGVNLEIGQIWMKWKIVIKSGPNQTAPKCSTNWQDFFCLCFFSQRLSCQFFLSQHLQWENRKWFQNTFYSKASL